MKRRENSDCSLGNETIHDDHSQMHSPGDSLLPWKAEQLGFLVTVLNAPQQWKFRRLVPAAAKKFFNFLIFWFAK